MKLSDRRVPSVREGTPVVFSAGFNVDAELVETSRIDVELDDLARLSDNGARVAVLAHQGDFRSGTARHLEDVAGYLSTRLARPVEYVADNATSRATRHAATMPPGAVALFGNTRLNAGEQENDAALAATFAQLGSLAVIGGFCKAHRSHASNVGILALLPGRPAFSLLREIDLLRPWMALSERPSVAVLGGAKREKITLGLERLYDRYDAFVLGGVPLQATLAALGRADTGPVTARWGKGAWLHRLRRLLDRDGGRKIMLPQTLLIAPDEDSVATRTRELDVGCSVPTGWSVVDFQMDDAVARTLGRAADGGRILVAGSVSHCAAGHSEATDTLRGLLDTSRASVLVLGGDTRREGRLPGVASTGGGAALQLLAQGRTTVEAALGGRRLRW